MPFTKPKSSLLHLQLGPGMKVADLGAGSGRFSLEAARLVGGGGAVYAVEIRKELKSKIEREARDHNLTNIQALWGNIEEVEGTGIEENSIHAALLVNTLFQLKDKKGAFSEAYRILKPGGKLLVIDWSESFGGLGPRPDHIVDAKEARRLAEEVGFENLEKIKPGDHHYGFIAQKEV